MRRAPLLLLAACAGPVDGVRDTDEPLPDDTGTDLPHCGGLDEPCAALARADHQTCGADLTWDEAGQVDWPERASALRCLHGPTLAPGDDLVPYEVVAPLWTQGSHKSRWVVLPPGTTVAFAEEGEWGFPTGSVLVKRFDHDLVRDGTARPTPVELRFMVRTDRGWAFATYQWDEALGDAVLVPPEGRPVPVTVRREGRDHGITWRIPGLQECATCHRDAAEEALGPRTAQLDRDVVYDGLVANQLVAWWTAGLLDRRPEGTWTALSRPDGRGDLALRARSWLHANCAHCHQPGGFVSPDIHLDLRITTPLSASHACDGGGTFGRPPAIVPGDPDASEIVRRIEATGFDKMPPDGAELADAEGIALVRRWIAGMTSCP